MDGSSGCYVHVSADPRDDIRHVLRSDPASGAKHEVATSKQVVCVWWDFYASREEEGEPRKIRFAMSEEKLQDGDYIKTWYFFLKVKINIA